MKFQSISQYKTYVKSQLETIDLTQVVSSYDTGFGLHLVDEYLGETCHCLDVIHSSILKIQPPSGLSMGTSQNEADEWTEAWDWMRTKVRHLTSKQGA